MSSDIQLSIVKESSNAVLSQLSKHILSIIRNNDGVPVEIFSGTLIEIQNRLFVCTVGHSIRKTDNLHAYTILDRNPRDCVTERKYVVARHYSENDRIDVGLLELDRDAFLRDYAKTKEPCSIGRIKIRGSGNPRNLMSLIGSPGDLIAHEDSSKKQICVATFNSVVLDASGKIWDRLVRFGMPLDSRIDVVLEYPSGDRSRNLTSGESCSLPDPSGMSGGGLWDQGFQQDEVWSPDKAYLIGVQCSWDSKLDLVQAVQIIHWLRLVHQNYPDLRSLLENAFPAQVD